jgi:hypothetical protein
MALDDATVICKFIIHRVNQDSKAARRIETPRTKRQKALTDIQSS